MDSLSITQNRYLNVRLLLPLAMAFVSWVAFPQSPMSRIWLNMSHEENPGNQILVGYTDMATLEVDPGFDSALAPAGDCLSSLIGSEHYVIQARPAFEASDVVPLALHAESSGTFTIWLDHADGVFEQGQAIYLYDGLENKCSELSAASYVFTSESGDFDNRFQLLYQTSTLGLATSSQDTVSVYDESGVLTVHTGSETASCIQVFDLQGREIAQLKTPATLTASLPFVSAQREVRLVRIVYPSGRVLVRKIRF
ncbi:MULTISPECIES: hypothetical protein [unclassified Flavobacterium]|uniref:hypothetical protein n=1 Tax=unclassified Flavobacterium TaxID=196869 RepID=UPI001F13A5EF|nr:MULTISPECIES: hypothetical protein [unclassified Flavobacterium]UMY65765.1 hypothetical protein MKO97_14895 [Flavobacterium sp. HJ-32-4]